MPQPRIPFGHALRLRIEITDVRQAVWRTLLVDPEITLYRLHDVIQGGSDWENRYLFAFRAGDRYWSADESVAPRRVPPPRTRLLAAPPSTGRLDYEYDFGDGWDHAIQWQGHQACDRLRLPRCIAGANACPPEDGGGPPGYERVRAILADPTHTECAPIRRWAGKTFEPAKFPLVVANRRLRAT